MKCQDGKLWWTCNGQKIHNGAKLELSENGCVGVGSFKHTAGITLSLKKLEVRRLGVP
jgi:hypothetical protein